MKKLIATTLAALLIVGCFAGCSAKDDTETTTNPEATSEGIINATTEGTGDTDDTTKESGESTDTTKGTESTQTTDPAQATDPTKGTEPTKGTDTTESNPTETTEEIDENDPAYTEGTLGEDDTEIC